ncbi:MFS transporter [Actinomycetospora corticicola]|uniref:EmrB/QacA subfamily drug resistance transporter n=1 Tax=Actinomycetospora corticicola TaxID=663602 RepID=A0A7Y9J7A3_9PSEU|nr:MFS transporter [Actinomycetospora corticicola]NYD38272.1 EmrB/QacA subfamily drug resistance transporter [Actinomycetospora corticicola]
MANDSGGGPRHRWLVLGICCTSLLVVSMDNTIVNVALPAIRADLDASITELQWTVDAYTLVLACFLMLAGATGDRLGRRRTFQTGLAVFGLGSLLCSLAPSVGWLIAARAVQGLGGTMLNPIALSIVTNVFVDPRERARAIGVWGSVVGISLGLGPVLGGLLTETVGWRAIFWVNVPIVLAAIALTARYVPESRAAHARRPDPVGQLCVVVLLGSVTTAVIEAPRLGWASGAVIGLGVVAVVALAALLWWERRRREPLLELGFFASVPFSAATVIAVCAFAAFASFLFLCTLYLQEVRGLSSLAAGLALLPAAVTSTLCAPLSGRLVASRGARPSLVVAGVAMTISGVALSQVGPATPEWVLLGVFALFGIGFGMVNPPITNTAVSGMPRAQAGVAAAVASTSRQVGSTLGVAVAGTVVAAAATVGSGLPPAWFVAAGATAVVGVLGVVATTARARASADRVAAAFAEETAPARV